MSYKLFGDRRYYWAESALTKRIAQARAKKYRKQGYWARVTEEVGRYQIYTNPKVV